MHLLPDPDGDYIPILLVLTVSLICVVSVAPTAIAADSSSPPPIPAGYYGEVMINGEPAEVGTTVEAEINGEIRGLINVVESGQYGSFKAGGKRLSVTGSNSESGTATVTFYVNGDGFERTKVQNTNPETILWESQEVKQVNLSTQVEMDNSEDGNGGDSSGGGGGAGGGGGGGSGETGGSNSESENSPPSVQDVRDTLNLVEPSTNSETDIQDSDPDTPGTSVTLEGTESVRSINFDSDAVTGSVQVKEYADPPEEIRTQVSESIDGSGTLTSTDNQGSDSSGGRTNVISVTDITPTSEDSEQSLATVEFSVNRDRVDNPQQLTVIKEYYDFEAQETTWQRQETSVQEITNQEVIIETKIDSFSLFAVAEVSEEGREQEPRNNTEELNDTSEETENGIPGFNIPVALGALVITSLFARRYA